MIESVVNLADGHGTNGENKVCIYIIIAFKLVGMGKDTATSVQRILVPYHFEIVRFHFAISLDFILLWNLFPGEENNFMFEKNLKYRLFWIIASIDRVQVSLKKGIGQARNLLNQEVGDKVNVHRLREHGIAPIPRSGSQPVGALHSRRAPVSMCISEVKIVNKPSLWSKVSKP